jgi:predicted PurR-regulated permease PerM
LKLPWDKQYLKISFHVVVTALIIYALGLLLTNVSVVQASVSQVVSKLISVFAPLITALVFSFLMNPAVEFFQNRWEKYTPNKSYNGYRSRKRGTITLYVLLLVLVILLIRFIVVKIGSTDANALAKEINKQIQEFTDLFVLLDVKLMEYGVFHNLENVLTNWTTEISGFIQITISKIASSLTKAGGWVINLVLGLTIGFYLLMEKDKILKNCSNVVDVFFKEKTAKRIKSVCHEINHVFSGYLSGQVTDAVIMAVCISVSFSVVKIPYAILIGIISGFSNLIPYVGAIMAFLLSVSVGLLSGEPIKALYAVIIVLVLQQIDSIFIVPRVVGKSVELHPAMVLISLSVFGGLFGILGMVVAVPCGALFKTLVVWIYEREKEKKYG